SVGYSPLSLLASDHRKLLFKSANHWETVDGIDCYLWRSPIHPFGKGLGNLQSLTNRLFKWWIQSSCPALDEAAAQADLIIVESGIGAALMGRLRNAAPNASLVYLVSDLLETVGAHPFIEDQLFKDRTAISDIVVVARAMAGHFEAFDRPVHFIQHGISKIDFENIGATPYTAPLNIVTVGSMLFDSGFFKIASDSFPSVQFHLIGTPELEFKSDNIREYGRMPFKDTLPYLKYANAGIAPYHDQDHADYLADSSMKLMQYEYLKLPAICPDFAAGDRHNRYGYRPGNQDSITTAIQHALANPFAAEAAEILDWKDVANHLMSLGQS
ncbi:MAG: hypothetical protein ABJP82_19395, partial [Hyphomicrobiales bacterium]